VQVLDGSRWDGQSPEGAPFLREGIDPRQGPTCQIWILPGATTRIVVRTHHALMDGQGTLLLARALFAALRGEELPTAELGPTTDEDIACELGRSGEAPQPRRFGAPTGLAESAPFEITWGRVRIPGKVSRLLPRIAVSLAQYSQEDAALPLRFAVPVDMRRHRPGLQSSANLTGLARLDMAPLLATKDPVEAVAQALEAAMARGAEAAVVRSSRIARWLPLSWMGWIGTQNARRCLGDGRYPSSGVLSNLGRLRLEAFSGGGFTAQRAFFIPPGNPGLPLFLSMAGDSEGIELCAAVPCGLATQDRLSSLLEHLRTVCLSS
jgi:hypothetical protein